MIKRVYFPLEVSTENAIFCSVKGSSINYVVSEGEGVKNCRFYLVKRQLIGGGGSKIADFEMT